MIISDNGIKIEQKDYKDEKELQALVFEHPELLCEEGSELVSIMREVRTGAGVIDMLAMTASGIITLVEVKLERNAQIRREVLAQIFDYISELSNYSYFKLNEATGGALERAVDSFENSAELPRIIEDNLKNGLVRLVIAVDEPRDDLRRLVEFVARHTDFRVDLVEIKKYLNNEEYYYSSNLVVQSSFSMERNGPKKEYPLLDKAVALWKQSGSPFEVKNSSMSFRQIRMDRWPAALHYEFVILNNKPILYIRLDNELSASDPRSDYLSEIIEQFRGKYICGYKLETRSYSRNGSGKILYVSLPEEDVDKAPAIMAELIEMTKESIDQVIGGSMAKPTTFEMLGIPDGSVLEPLNDRYPRVVTVGTKNMVRLEDGSEKAISRVASDVSGTARNGFACYKYNGEILTDIRKRLENDGVSY